MKDPDLRGSPDAYGITLPPHSIPSEQGVLSCIIQEPTQVLTLAMTFGLEPDDFYDLRHRSIFEMILDMHSSGKAVDFVTITSELMSRKLMEAVGGGLYLSEITDKAPSHHHAKDYIEELKHKTALRRALEACNKSILDIYANEHEADAVLDRLDSAVASVRRQKREGEVKTMSELVSIVIDRMESGQGKTLGIPSGVPDIDKMLRGGGARPGDLVVVAARPSGGKTAFVVNWAISAAKGILAEFEPGSEMPEVLVFSLEMEDTSIAERMMGIVANVNMQTASTAISEAEAARLMDATGLVSSFPMQIYRTPGLGISDISARVKMRSSKVRVRAVFIDYLQIIQPGNEQNRQEAVAAISRGLKMMAKETGCPVVVAAQLSRKTETENRMPKLSDLKESGQIEQDADLIMFLHPRSGDKDQPTYTTGPTPIWGIVAKQRDGPTGSVPLEFQKPTQTFHGVSRVEVEESEDVPRKRKW